MLGFELTHIFLWAAFITCLLKPRNFPLGLLFILVHFLFIDVVSENYLFVGVKLSPQSWLLLQALVAFFYGCITYISKNYYLVAIFLLTFAIKSYIYIVDPNQAANFLWHGYGNLYYENILGWNISRILSLSVYVILIAENVKSYTDRHLSFIDHIVRSHRELFVYLKNETVALYQENKKVLFDPYFKKAGNK